MRTLVLIAMLASLGCKGPAGAPKAAPLKAAEVAELELLAGKLEVAMESCDAEAFATLCDQDWLARSVAAAEGDAKAVYASVSGRQSLLSEFFCIGSDIRYVGTRPAGGAHHLAYRVHDGAEPRYVEVLAGKAATESAQCVDLIELDTGWRLRDLASGTPRLRKHAETFAAVRAQLAQDPLAVEANYQSEVAALSVLAVAAAAHRSVAEYESALQQFQVKHPDSLAVFVVAAEELARAGHFAAAADAVKVLGDALGDEAALLSKRVGFLLDAEEYELATELSEAALKAHPEDREAHERLLEVLVLSRNFGGAVAVMRLLGERFDIRFTAEGMDTSHPAYEELLASDAWAAY